MKKSDYFTSVTITENSKYQTEMQTKFSDKKKKIKLEFGQPREIKIDLCPKQNRVNGIKI